MDRSLPTDLFYHNVAHTLDVKSAAIQYAKLEHVGDEDLILVETSALMHDIGFVKQYKENEPIAAEMAANILPEFGYSPTQIDIIKNCILATSVPQRPLHLLEKIVCDADLDYLGREDYFTIAANLRNEWMAYGLIDNDIHHWNRVQYHFLLGHHYFTESANRLRGNVKEINIQMIAKTLNL